VSEIVVYRQYWMATIKDRHCCQICGELAINAFEYVDKNGTCTKVVWLCDEENQTRMMAFKVG